MAIKHVRAVAIATVALAALAGCSAPGGTDAPAAGGGDCAPAGGDVELSFTSWVPGVTKVVDIWNKANPDIQVKVSEVPSGNAGTYQNFFNQLTAGDAPDIGQVEYDTLPAFRVQDGLLNIAACEGITDAESEFSEGLWNQVTFGEADSVYAIPQDSGPMAMYYRADLFEANNIPIPTTWDEYAAAAETINGLGGKITNFPDGDVNWFAGLVSQAGGQWFSVSDDAWSVELTSDVSAKVANYWQDLIDKKLVSTIPGFTDQWNNAYDTGAAWTWVSAVWGANSISSGAPSTAGNWAVAPMPQWDSSEPTSGAWGGSSSVVFKGSEYPAEASKFLLWLNTSTEALTALNAEADLFPASKTGAELPAISEGVAFYGDQKIYEFFAEQGQAVSPFTWGPTMTQTYSDVSDGFAAAIAGNGTLLDALEQGQAKTIAALEAQSIPVK